MTTELSNRFQATWAAGDFHQIGMQAQAVSQNLVEQVDLHAGERVLDVACGSGNTALAAARHYAQVTGVDFVPELLERGAQRASAEGIPVEFVQGDAAELPFADASFDVVLSSFGHMFAPDQKRAAAELVRVCRPGGRIGLATWPPSGYVIEMFNLVSEYGPPPAPGSAPTSNWGQPPMILELLGDRIATLRFADASFRQRFLSPEHAAEVYSRYFGPVHSLVAGLSGQRLADFQSDFMAMFNRLNRAGDGTMVLCLDYLVTVAVRS